MVELTREELDTAVALGARSGDEKDTTVFQRLQATTRARVGKNGDNEERRKRRTWLRGSYSREMQEQMSSSSTTKRRSEEWRGHGGGLSSGMDGDSNGVI